MRLAYTYQRIMDAAQTLNACIRDVVTNDRDALGPRGKRLLNAAASLAGVASWIARDRRDAICPESADDTIVMKGTPQ